MNKGLAIGIILAVLAIAGAVYYFTQKTSKTIKDSTNKLAGTATTDIQALTAKSGDIKDIFSSADDISKNINALLGRNVTPQTA